MNLKQKLSLSYSRDTSVFFISISPLEEEFEKHRVSRSAAEVPKSTIC